MAGRGAVRGSVRVWISIAVLGAGGACGTEVVGDDARGRGHSVAQLPAASVVSAYAAAVRAAFDVGPDLHLLAEPTYLPRSSGYGAGDSIPAPLLAALEKGRVVQGTCSPDRSSERRAPTCPARRAGYVTRFSELFQLGGDTVELYLQSEVYAPSGGSGQQPFSFEMAYQLAPRSGGWRVVREGRVRQSDGGGKR